ncbi:MAG: insulinase family protein [Planctomycetes bacterium]|nr:insulinase family protein [Planctomycetota bacterium]
MPKASGVRPTKSRVEFERVVDFEKCELAEGVRLFVHPTTKFKTVFLRVFIHEPLGADVTRIALLPHLLRRGCRRTPTMRAITTFLEDLYGASFGADVFKMGEQQVTSFSLDVVNDRYTPRNIGALRRAIEFLGRVISEPVLRKGVFPPEVVAQEKENLKRLIEGLINDRASYAYERCLREMCKNEPYHIYEYGRIEDLPRLDPASLREMHLRILRAAPIDVFVVGDVAPQKIASMVRGAFGKLRRGEVSMPPPTTDRAAPAVPREIVEKMDVEQGNLVIGARTGIRWSDDEIFALSMANGILGGFAHSKLFVNVRERDNLAYSVHSWIDLAKGVLFITAGIDFAKYADALRTIREELAAVQAGRISDEEMEKTRASLVDRVRSRDDSPTGKIGVLHEMLWHGRVMPGAEMIERTKAVSTAEVVAAAKKIRLDTIYFLTRA